MPSTEELQKYYLYFDELQTSVHFLEGVHSVLKREKVDSHIVSSGELKKLTFLEKKGILSLSEDIENRILPITGVFDEKKRLDLIREIEGRDNFDLSILEYLKSISVISEQYNLDVRGVSFKEKKPQDDFSPLKEIKLLGILRCSPYDRVFENNSKNISDLEKKELILKFISGTEVYSRIACRLLNDYFNDNLYVPIVRGVSYNPINNMISGSLIKFQKQNVVNLVINKFPVPSEGVDWNTLISFKNDKDSIKKLVNLRLWVDEITSKKDINLANIEDQLNQLIFEYEEQLNIHKIKHIPSAVEAFLLPILEATENIARFKFSSAAKSLFNFNKKRVDMLESENTLMKSEIAYISKMNNNFS